NTSLVPMSAALIRNEMKNSTAATMPSMRELLSWGEPPYAPPSRIHSTDRHMTGPGRRSVTADGSCARGRTSARSADLRAARCVRRRCADPPVEGDRPARGADGGEDTERRREPRGRGARWKRQEPRRRPPFAGTPSSCRRPTGQPRRLGPLPRTGPRGGRPPPRRSRSPTAAERDQFSVVPSGHPFLLRECAEHMRDTSLVQVADGVHLVHGSNTNWVVLSEGDSATLVDCGYPGDRALLLASLSA